jgi:hypothetical protein
MRTGRHALFAAALSVVAASACGYGPEIESGRLLCGPGGSCPEGYCCGANQTCWSEDIAGACEDPTLANLIGHWVFVAPSRRVIACNDGFTEDMTAWTDYFDVEEGGSAELRSFYYCDLDLDVGANGATVLVSNRSCDQPDPQTPGAMFTYTPTAFTLSTTNGVNGSLAASIPYTAGPTTAQVSCTMNFTGTLTKN